MYQSKALETETFRNDILKHEKRVEQNDSSHHIIATLSESNATNLIWHIHSQK